MSTTPSEEGFPLTGIDVHLQIFVTLLCISYYNQVFLARDRVLGNLSFHIIAESYC